jgi:hypothetical protein
MEHVDAVAAHLITKIRRAIMAGRQGDALEWLQGLEDRLEAEGLNRTREVLR